VEPRDIFRTTGGDSRRDFSTPVDALSCDSEDLRGVGDVSSDSEGNNIILDFKELEVGESSI
jgi:hypothetical protein